MLKYDIEIQVKRYINTRNLLSLQGIKVITRSGVADDAFRVEAPGIFCRNH